MTTSSFIRRLLTTAVTAAVLSGVTDASKAAPALYSTQGLKAAVSSDLIEVGFYFDGYVPGPFIGDPVIDPWGPVIVPPYFLPYELPYPYFEPAVFCPPLIFYGSGRLAERTVGPYPPTRYASIYAGFGRTWASFPHRPFRGYRGSPTHIPAKWTPVRQ